MELVSEPKELGSEPEELAPSLWSSAPSLRSWLLAPGFKVYTCVINNPYLSIGIHLFMYIFVRLIP
jgi:hypothetical protein